MEIQLAVNECCRGDLSKRFQVVLTEEHYRNLVRLVKKQY